MSYCSAKWRKTLGLKFGPPVKLISENLSAFLCGGLAVLLAGDLIAKHLAWTFINSSSQPEAVHTHTHTHTHTTGLVYAPNSDHHIISNYEASYVISIKYKLSFPDDGSCLIRYMLE